MSTVVYDSILGKLREAEIGGGTGGGGGVQTTILGGFRISVTSAGDSATVAQDKLFPITNVTGNTVTMQPGEAYKIQATTAAVTINTTDIPSNQYGLESHLEIFVANTGYIVTGSNVVLANALEPDAVNNCTVRFHDVLAIISVEDHVAGYIVTVNAASGAGSLAYGLATATNEYISVDASLNGQTLDLAGATTYAGEKHVVGNGYTETIVSGGINCTSKTTLSNLAADGVIVSSGTLTLGDVFIPSGATVSVIGGSLAVEKVSGGVINGANTQPVDVSAGSYLENVTIESCYGNSTRDSVRIYNGATFSSCTFRKNIGSGDYATMRVMDGATVIFKDSLDAEEVNNSYSRFTVNSGGTLVLSGSTISDVITLVNGNVAWNGSNSITGWIEAFKNQPARAGSVVISSGAIIDLTGNSNANAIKPGGAVIVEGGCTVINSAGASVSIAGGTYSTIKNDGTTN